jgi:hypothetical protein
MALYRDHVDASPELDTCLFLSRLYGWKCFSKLFFDEIQRSILLDLTGFHCGIRDVDA